MLWVSTDVSNAVFLVKTDFLRLSTTNHKGQNVSLLINLVYKGDVAADRNGVDPVSLQFCARWVKIVQWKWS